MAKKHVETGFTDISSEVEELAADDQASEAYAAVAAEHTHRAIAASNGGGPWPKELLLARYTKGTPVKR